MANKLSRQHLHVAVELDVFLTRILPNLIFYLKSQLCPPNITFNDFPFIETFIIVVDMLKSFSIQHFTESEILLFPLTYIHIP